MGHLVNMKRLHTLEFVEPSDSYSHNNNHSLNISVAGEVPSLRNFAFYLSDNHQNQFIDGFAEKYPQKYLLVRYLRYVPVIPVIYLNCVLIVLLFIHQNLSRYDNYQYYFQKALVCQDGNAQH